MLAGDPKDSQPTQVVLTPFTFKPTRISLIILNMPSYKNLVIIALAAFSVSPALSAPTRYVNVYRRERGPHDGWIPLESIRSSLEASVKNGDHLVAVQDSRTRLLRVGLLPSWRVVRQLNRSLKWGGSGTRDSTGC